MFALILALFLVLACTIAFHVPTARPMVTQRNLFGSPETPKAGGGDKGLFGGMGDLMGQMKKAQEIAKQAEVMNRELAGEIIVGQDPAGLAAATFNGLGQPIGLRLSESCMKLSAEEASMAATQAMVDAHSRSQGLMMQKMQALYAGTGLPGMQ